MVADLRGKMSFFHKSMPSWMSLSRLLMEDQGSSASGLRGVIFYVHLFYLSAMIFLSRRLIIAHIPLNSVGRIVVPRQSSQAIEEGFMAAKTNARVLDLMLTAGSVVQTCWLSLFTAHTACIMITYGAIQKALSGLHPTGWADDIQLISKCFRTLTYCAEKDALAGVFRDNLNRYITVLQDFNGRNDIPGQEQEASLGDVLFTIHPGMTYLHAAARDLLRFIHRPFDGLQNPPLQATVGNCIEAALGTHVEWLWKLKGGSCATPETAPGMADMGDPTNGGLQQHDLQSWTTWTPPAVTRVG